jgi:hypothetical protein
LGEVRGVIVEEVRKVATGVIVEGVVVILVVKTVV